MGSPAAKKGIALILADSIHGASRKGGTAAPDYDADPPEDEEDDGSDQLAAFAELKAALLPEGDDADGLAALKTLVRACKGH